MTVQVPAILSFAGGQTSFDLSARVDMAHYGQSFAIVVNFLGFKAGAMQKAPGTTFEAPARNQAEPSRLIDWAFEPGDALVLEFAARTIRFFGEGGQVVDDNGAPLEVITPYRADELPAVRVEQAGDVMYLAHPNHPPQQLVRTGATDWALEPFPFEGGPWKPFNADEDSTLYASGVTGEVTISSSGPMFEPGHVGGLLEIENGDDVAYPPWQTAQPKNNGDQVIYDGKVYEAVNDEVGAPPPVKTGGTPPTHTKGVEADGGDLGGDVNVRWRYIHDQRGYVRVIEYISPTEVRAEVVERLPQEVVGAGGSTPNWRLGAWSGAEGWPSDVKFYAQSGNRLVWAKGARLHFSVSSDFANYQTRTFGEALADSAFDVTVSDRGLAPIRWISSDERGLVVGTAKGEQVVGPSTVAQSIAFDNVAVTPLTHYGGRAIDPAHPNAATAFVERNGRRIRLAGFVGERGGWSAQDATTFASQITKSGVSAMAWQGQTFEHLWIVTNDGRLAAMLYDPEQGVMSWWPIDVGGEVESVAVRQADDTDELWLAVKRVVGGQERRFIERMAQPAELADPYDYDAYERSYRDPVRATQHRPYHVWCGLTYDGAPTQVIYGLEHLEGEEVAIWADGADHPRRTVENGSISLKRPYGVVHVGLPLVAKALTHRLEAAASQGSIAQATKRRLVGCTFRVFNSSQFRYGQSLRPEHLETLPMRYDDDRMDEGPFLKSGDFYGQAAGAHDLDCRLAIVSDTAGPLTLLAAFPKVVGGGQGGQGVSGAGR